MKHPSADENVRRTSRRALLLGVRVAVVLAVVFGVAQRASTQTGINTFDWAWGELFYGRTYKTKLTVTNKCKTARPVTIYINDPIAHAGSHGAHLSSTKRANSINVPPGTPYRITPDGNDPFRPGDKWPLSARVLLSFPGIRCSMLASGGGAISDPHLSWGRSTMCKLVAQPGKTDIDVVITTPPEPDLSHVLVPPGFDPVNVYDIVEGELRIRGSDSQLCSNTEDDYFASGHVHVDPDPHKPSPFGHMPDCRVWWETGRRPPSLVKDCTKEFRELASTYRTQVLDPLVIRAPEAWAWLPSLEEIQQMLAPQLLDMKKRADGQLGGQ